MCAAEDGRYRRMYDLQTLGGRKVPVAPSLPQSESKTASDSEGEEEAPAVVTRMAGPVLIDVDKESLIHAPAAVLVKPDTERVRPWVFVLCHQPLGITSSVCVCVCV